MPINKHHFGQFKGLVYEPCQTMKYLVDKGTGKIASMRREYAACNSTEDHWQFACSHLLPCQIKSEIFNFIDLLNEIKPKTLVEIGLAAGGTNYLLRNCVPSLEHVIGVDFYPRNLRMHGWLHPESVKLEFVRGSSYAESTLAAVRNKLGGKKIDLLFIDGDHSYKGVMADYKAYIPLVAPDGWVTFHDIHHDPHRTKPEGANGFPVEVDRAWRELSEGQIKHEFIDSPNQSYRGIGVMKNPGLSEQHAG